MTLDGKEQLHSLSIKSLEKIPEWKSKNCMISVQDISLLWLFLSRHFLDSCTKNLFTCSGKKMCENKKSLYVCSGENEWIEDSHLPCY